MQTIVSIGFCQARHQRSNNRGSLGLRGNLVRDGGSMFPDWFPHACRLGLIVLTDERRAGRSYAGVNPNMVREIGRS